MADASVTAFPEYPQEVDGLPDVNLLETPVTNTVSSESSVSCRICKFNAGTDLISSPCHCKGTLGWVHVTCLEEWLTGSVRDSCELCSFPFTVVRIPKYGYLESLRIFLTTRISILRLLRDLFFLAVSLINTCILMYMWLAYILNDLVVIMEGNTDDRQILEGSLKYLTTPLRTFAFSFVFTLCLGFVSLNTFDDFRRIFYFYFLPWYHWRRSAVEVKLIVDLYNVPA
ncbi:E3 ubiquitin-protein ligase MARCHF1-like [Macrosteles quadrilineatus]|uniref:E3 ubiquitin-protein ligase MARCHF1-like n=1 Tax=Macrosteles quadrilineatus TaxID=74068 RepID=UPI0023E22F7E|nr:E3 ubiquitin-protein ligase MARCHF1-like [Macrosteles quadrilineatus]